MENLKIAILIPCYNEEKTIQAVVNDLHIELPSAEIYVYDNMSTDNTIELAKQTVAKVYQEPRKGKGNVVRRMFNDIEADIYLLVDGDNTYHASSASQLITALIHGKLDMVIGTRKSTSEDCYRLGHEWGNSLFNFVIRILFGRQFKDIFSGYRVFSRRFVKSFPCLSSGFEIETEMSVHALEMRLPTVEIETPYAERPEGSTSKLRTYRDGFRILKTIIKLFKEVRPFLFFFFFSLLLFISAFILFIPLLITYFETGMVPRFPTAILVTSLMLLSFLCLFSGTILESISRARVENKRLLYLAVKN